MAVARLTRVTLQAGVSEVGMLIARVIEFGDFHPARREGMVQDIGLLLLQSRAHEIYSRATEILDKGGIGKVERVEGVEKFQGRDVEELLGSLEEYLEIIEENISLFKEAKDREGATRVLLAVQEASLMVFNDLGRIFVHPPEGGTMRFEGFVPSSSMKTFRERMGAHLLSAEPVEARSEDAAYVPTLLVNPRLVSAFESLTLMRGLPRYGEVDPTPMLALVFPFFFGIMFADVGHGAALLAFGLYLVYRTTWKNWGKLLLTLSLSTTLFGFVRGSFFSVTFSSPLERVVHIPLAITAGFTLSSIPFLLEVAVTIGTFHLASGYAIAFLNEEKAGDHLEAFLDRLPTVLLYTFLVPFAFAVAGAGLDLGALFTSNAATPVFDDLLGLEIPVSETARFSLPVIVASLVVLASGEPVRDYISTRTLRSALKSLGRGVFEAAAKPFEFFLNTISYIRLGVLLITTTLLGSLVMGVLSAGVLGVVLAAFLNLAVISLEGVIVYVQDMRLQLYEWLSKFYAGTGTPFVPLVSGGRHFAANWR